MSMLNANAKPWTPSWASAPKPTPQPQPQQQPPQQQPTAQRVVPVAPPPEPKPEPEPEVQDSWEDAADDDAGETEASAPAATTEEPKEPEPKKEEITKEPAPQTAAPSTTSESKPEEKPKPKKEKKKIARDPRPHLNIVFIGHVDAGKSTISGHMLYLTGQVDERTMEKFEREAKAKNRESWKYAWAMDIEDSEREKGKTHETGAGYFATKDRRFTILDAPGHKAFVPSMIGGACQADLAILVISARKGEFETGFERGGQTREHAILIKTAGVRHLFVVINKMDDPTVEWGKDRYDEIVGKLTPFLKGTGFAKNAFTFMPVSGLAGDNLAEKLPAGVCPWYQGPCLLDQLNTIPCPEMSEDEPLRFPIQGKFKEMGLVVHGKCESGSVTVGDKLMIQPTGLKVVVDGMARESDEIERCFPGDNVHLRLKGVEEEDLRPGFCLCEIDRPVQATTVFTAQVLMLECKNILTTGYTCVLHLHALVEECQVASLLCTLDKKGKIIEKHPKFVKGGETVLLRLQVAQACVVEPFKTFSKMGRFVLRDEGKTIGVGVVTKLIDMATLGTANNE